MTEAQIDTSKKFNSDHNTSVLQFILHPQPLNLNSQTEKSLDVKLARKGNKNTKGVLKGLFGELALFSTPENVSYNSCCQRTRLSRIGNKKQRYKQVQHKCRRKLICGNMRNRGNMRIVRFCFRNDDSGKN